VPLVLPDATRLAVSVGVDFDAQSVWMGSFDLRSPAYLSRGEFGAEVGVPRVLHALRQHAITTTWCVPTHTLQTFPRACEDILADGHEIAAHGVYHERVGQLAADEERRLLELQLDQHVALLGRRPAGYRSPAWDFSEATLSLLQEYDFVWDSSLMGRDFEVYRPRPVTRRDNETGNRFGPEANLLEIPVSWALDDFPPLEHLPRSVGLGDTETVLSRWRDTFEFAYQRVPGGVFTLAVHPQTVGRAHVMLMFERFLEEIASHEGIWFATLSQIAASYVDPAPADGRSPGS
jgi:peptidoglycan/xylan/chitin deacetylase (PgdA/CDA1 family)